MGGSKGAIDRSGEPLELVDKYGRVARDLRVSLTDKCNLRCSYCMPSEGLEWLPKPSLLTDDEVVRLVRIGVELLGIRQVRLTGGEPLLRPGLPDVIAAIHELSPTPELSLTTNGIGLALVAPALKSAGLRRINVSLDTLRPARFVTLAKRDRLTDVLAGLEAARSAGLTPVKVNAVLMRGVNDDEASELLQFALAEGYELRFIEQMPLDPMHGWTRDSMVTADEILAMLSRDFGLTPDDAERGSAPAQVWRVNGTSAKVGIIASVTRAFCGACDRTRLTADGQIRNCLFATEESDLRGAMRSGATDAELAHRWVAATTNKAAGHGIDDRSFLQPTRPMSAIGG
ncbi:MAG: GTP 3',8-cyclase MoaA [Actinobacteria bacterium]|nr:GTP 3',8-cyclase MoaA [Actinomycetota bacterium]